MSGYVSDHIREVTQLRELLAAQGVTEIDNDFRAHLASSQEASYRERYLEALELTLYDRQATWDKEHPQLALKREILELLREDERVLPQEQMTMSVEEIVAAYDERGLLRTMADQLGDGNKTINLSAKYDVDGSVEYSREDIYKNVLNRHQTAAAELLKYEFISDAVRSGVVSLETGEPVLGLLYKTNRIESRLQNYHDASLGDKDAQARVWADQESRERPISLDRHERLREHQIEHRNDYGMSM